MAESNEFDSDSAECSPTSGSACVGLASPWSLEASRRDRGAQKESACVGGSCRGGLGRRLALSMREDTALTGSCEHAWKKRELCMTYSFAATSLWVFAGLLPCPLQRVAIGSGFCSHRTLERHQHVSSLSHFDWHGGLIRACYRARPYLFHVWRIEDTTASFLGFRHQHPRC